MDIDIIRDRLTPKQIKFCVLVQTLPSRGIALYSGGRTLDLASQGLTLEPCAFFSHEINWPALESWLINACALNP
jgi:hypothetical protein